MSKLIDKLQKSFQTVAPSMGFKTRTDTPKNQVMPFIAAISIKNIDWISDILAIGIDALLLLVDTKEQMKSSLTELSKNMQDTPWGLLLNDISEEQIDEFINAGCDFIVFEAKEAPASLSEQSKLGKLLIMEESLNDGLVETVCQLPIDAVVFDLREQLNPSMLNLMQCQYYADLTDKPLFSIASPTINTSILEALHKHCVDGVIIEIKTKSLLKQAANVRQIINKLPPIKGRGKKKEGLIPSLGSLSVFSSEDEYEEEEV